jgi:NADH:ubiquinone oxidoreductase subunit F (NADH-binding)
MPVPTPVLQPVVLTRRTQLERTVSEPEGILGELGDGPGGRISLASHRSRYGRPTEAKPRPNLQLLEHLDGAGLRGRGGAGFPTGRKLRAVAERAQRSKRPVVVVNGTEGEPGSGKDRLVLMRSPHLVIDGAMWAAAAVGANRICICVDRTRIDACAALDEALVERQASEGGDPDFEITLLRTPPRYIAGEESALVRWINGGPAKPSGGRRPFESGVKGRPTLVQNAETMARLAQIANFGSNWFRQDGPPEEPGRALFSISGAVEHPVVVEMPIGTTVGRLIDMAGRREELQAVLVGGFFGTWIPYGEVADVPASRSGLAPFGGSPGAGVLIALPVSSCGLVETARILAWYAAESAGQCGPCLYGLADLAAAAGRLASAPSRPGDLDQMQRCAGQIDGRGGCRHPDGAVRLFRSAVRTFGAELRLHLDDGRCSATSAEPVVVVPDTISGWR